jgi:hypothetical protein
MARRALAGKDRKMIQGQRRDAFFKSMRRKGGVPRMPTAAPEAAATAEATDTSTDTEERSDVAVEAEPTSTDEAQSTAEG